MANIVCIVEPRINRAILTPQPTISIHGPLMVHNRKKKHSKNSHLMIYFPTSSEMSEWATERREQCKASKWVNRRATDAVLTSGLLTILDHSGPAHFFPSAPSIPFFHIVICVYVCLYFFLIKTDIICVSEKKTSRVRLHPLKSSVWWRWAELYITMDIENIMVHIQRGKWDQKRDRLWIPNGSW